MRVYMIDRNIVSKISSGFKNCSIEDKKGIRIFWLIGSYHDDGTNHQLSGLPG